MGSSRCGVHTRLFLHRIGNIYVQHCNREANKVAHTLARHALDSNSSVFWDDNPPSFIVPAAINDVSLFKLK